MGNYLYELMVLKSRRENGQKIQSYTVVHYEQSCTNVALYFTKGVTRKEVATVAQVSERIIRRYKENI